MLISDSPHKWQEAAVEIYETIVLQSFYKPSLAHRCSRCVQEI